MTRRERLYLLAGAEQAERARWMRLARECDDPISRQVCVKTALAFHAASRAYLHAARFITEVTHAH